MCVVYFCMHVSCGCLHNSRVWRSGVDVKMSSSVTSLCYFFEERSLPEPGASTDYDLKGENLYENIHTNNIIYWTGCIYAFQNICLCIKIWLYQQLMKKRPCIWKRVKDRCRGRVCCERKEKRNYVILISKT